MQQSYITRRPRIWAIALIAIVVLCIFYYFVDPESSRWMPRCMLHDLTGYQCPGCGMQRAIYLALHGNILEAWSMNYALPGIIIIVGIYAVAEALRTRHQRLYLALHHPIAIAILFALTFGWWIGRNIAGV